MRLFLFGILLLTFACAKKTDYQTEPTFHILQAVCDVETRRHGQDATVDHFGNIHMDEYIANPGDPKVLEDFWFESSGVCRGALAQLMVEAHTNYIRKSFKRLLPVMNERDKIALSRSLRFLDIPNVDFIYLTFLSQDQPLAVREDVTTALEYIDQKKHKDHIIRFMRNEKNIPVLRALLLGLDFDNVPEFVDVLPELRQNPSFDLHQRIMTVLSTSELKEKKDHIAAYLKHPEPRVRGAAESFLASLDEKEKLSLDFNINAAGRIADESKVFSPAMEDALAKRDMLKVLQLIDEGVNINAVDENSRTLLLRIAVRFFPNWFYREVIARGADLTMRDKDGRTAIFHAAMHGRTTLIKDLILNGAEPGISDNAGMTPREIALTMGFDKSVERFDDHFNNGRDLSLVEAVRNKDLDTARKLLQNGITPLQRDQKALTPLMIASINGTLDMVQLLLKYGANHSDRDQNGRRVDNLALLAGHEHIFDFFEQREKSNVMHRAILRAILENDFQRLRMIFFNTQIPDDQLLSDPELIFFAIRKGNNQIVEELIKRGINLNGSSAEGLSPASFAREQGQHDIADILSSH